MSQAFAGSASTVDTYYGAFSTEEPIAVPSFRGLEPSLRLAYSSTGGGGAAGIGWGLEGFSAVGRAGPGKGSPRYDGADVFLLDGQELVPCAGGSTSPSCTTGGTHSTRIENYQRIKFDAAANTWTVWRKDGTRLSYGPLFQAYRGGTFVGTFRWGLNSVVDTSGNTVGYGWWCDGSPAQECYPDNASYNGTSVKLYYELRPDPVSYGNGSSTLGLSRYRLKTVDVTTSGTRVRAYRLSYTTSTSPARSLLASVQQFGRDATVDGSGTVTSGSALPAVSFSWPQEGQGFAAASNWANNPYRSSPEWTRFGDFNGDGKLDMLQQYNNDNYVFLSTGSGYAAPANWGNNPYRGDAQWTHFGDFNGDGRTDMLQQYSYYSYVYLSTGSGFAPVANWGHNPYQGPAAAWTRFGDFNGDGKLDMLQQYNNDNYVFLSTGNGFAAPVNWGNNPYRGDAQWTHFGDFNGDGRTDMLQQYSYYSYVYLSTGSGFAPVANWGYNPYQSTTSAWTRFGDFNGDGRLDLLQQYNNDSYVFLSTGNGFAAPVNWGNNPYRSSPEWTHFGDFNGDGRTDMLQQSSNYNYLYLSAGSGFAPVANWGYNPYQSTTSAWTRFGDHNGDGKLDLLQQYGNDNYVYLTNPGHLLLSSVSNGLGGTTAIGYTPSTAWSNTSLPVGFVLQTVSSVQGCDGRGSCSTTRYSYQGGLWSSSERRFLGFRKVTSVLDAAGNYTETYYHQHVGCISKPEVTYYRDASGNLFKYSTFGYSENAVAPYTSLMTERWEYECNQSSSCRRTLLQIGYDEYGNGNLTYEYGDYDVGGDERTSLRGVVPNTGAYIVGMPAYENIYAGIGTAGSQLLKHTLHEYDGSGTYVAAPARGLVTRQLAWNNQTGGYITRDFGYDAWGNRTSETNELGAVSRSEYDATYHVHETLRCNALGQCSTKTWAGALDLIQSETDINGNVTTYAHDALGRPLQTLLPDGSTESFAYLDWGNPWLQRVRRTVSDGTADGLWSEVYEDGLGRRYKTVKEGGATQESLYSDGSSRVWKKSAWYGSGETPRYQVFSFDGLGRLRTVTNPDNTVGQRVYGTGYVVSYDELGQEKVVWTDAYGRMSQVRERNGSTYQYTAYVYDLLGNLTRVTDAAGNVTSVSWDSLGRKLVGCDPDTGCSSFTHDAAGRVLTYRDAKGQVTSYSYDALGRRLTKTLADGKQTRWVYDEAGRGASKGTLTSVVEPIGGESRVYDVAGRVTSLTKCVSGNCYTLGYAYDAAGRLSRLTYPDGEVVPYGYDAAGRLSSVGGYVNALGYNSRDQLVSATYANGTTASYSYADTRQWMTAASVSGPAGSVFQASYAYDAGGRVTSMSSSTHALANLSYSYDSLNRLTGVSGSQSQGFVYDALGNITWNSQVGNYQYGDGAHRHAVTAAGAAGYGYDVNGNLVSGGGRTLEWDADNRLARATTASGTSAFAYDANGQRVMKSSAAGTTRYFGALLELGPSGLTKSYFAGPMLVARRDSSGATWYHQDHLGSVRALTNQWGQRVATHDYSAFGARVASSGSVASTRGYGGHETDESGLVYMNARYYDPQLGRFISPDTVVPSPDNPQALNRYTYVYNNPISNTDPTGHVPVVAALITVVSVGVATSFAGTAFVISVVGAATMTVGYVLKDPMLMSIGGVLLGVASAYTFGAGFLGDKLTAQAAWAGGSVSALTSPVSPLDSNLKQAIGWAYTAQSLFYEFKQLDENIKKGAEKLREKFEPEQLEAIRAKKDAALNGVSAESKALRSDPSRWKPWQRQYGEAMEIATGGALTAGEAIALNSTGGLVGPDGGFFTQVLDVAVGWIPGVRAHGVLHDAAGFLGGKTFGVGPGYLYVGPGSHTYNYLGMKSHWPISGQLEGLTGTGGQSVSALFPRMF
ncbi:FG-GAP-like repeat-containing protein [Archangium violaceum]|uniref:FG-GAP-like repeat-containing protein n=1 Tax=Archangium violaceum TaxID=83451 RepID=UPI002B2DB97E|nr:FG-GAP-like repeat-containing protein [Archangium gephyra]